MNHIIIFEVVTLILLFILFSKFKFDRKFICLIFTEISIYLPLNEQDYNNLLQIKKDKTQRAMGLVRSCNLDEYTQKTTENKYFDFKFIVLFYLILLSSTLLNETRNIFYFITQKSQAHLLLEPNTKESTFNITSSFLFISLTYFIYSMLRKHIFHKGIWNALTKPFFIAFTVATSFFIALETFAPQLLNINYSSTNEIINNRINSLVHQIKVELNNNNNVITASNTNICNILYIKILFAIVFGVFVGVLYQPCIQLCKFDYSLLSKYETQDNTYGFNLNKIGVVIKIKNILNMLIMFILLEPLFKTLLPNITINKKIYFIILLITLCIEFICNVYAYWYYSFVYSMCVYGEIMKLNANPTKQNFLITSMNVKYLNMRFWEVALYVFYLVFFPILIAVSFASQSGLYSPGEEMKHFFFQNVLYVILLAIAVGKCMISSGYLYYKLFMKQKSKLEDIYQ